MPWQWFGGEDALNQVPSSTAAGAANIAVESFKLL